jgi:2-keto-4-pentenoate hydratase/2-oxohepta-3-ene-1,7-dioic acid hydratase in catechol pathway
LSRRALTAAGAKSTLRGTITRRDHAAGDVVELEVERIGVLRNRVVKP